MVIRLGEQFAPPRDQPRLPLCLVEHAIYHRLLHLLPALLLVPTEHLANAMLPPVCPIRLDDLNSMGVIRNVAESDMIVLSDAQHWAESDANPDPDARRKLVEIYGSDTAGDIENGGLLFALTRNA